MKNQGHFKRHLLSALVLSAIAISAQAATSEAWVATATKAHDPRNAVHVGPMRAGDQVEIVVSLKLRNKSQLDALTNALMSGKAGVKPLTSDQFLAAHAPTAAQADAVVSYLRSQGFVDIVVAPNRLLVSAKGGAGSVKNAFKAELHNYNTVDGRSAYANVTDALVPASLADSVQGILGLQTVHVAHVGAKRLSSSTQAVTPKAVSAVSIQNFGSIYGASSMPSATTATIGIITSGKVTQTITDLKSFASSVGYPVPPVTTSVIGTASSSTSGEDEWNMDSQSSLAAAGGTIKSMILYNVNSLSDANLSLGYNKAVTDHLAQVVNVSLGGCETDEGSAETSQDQIFQAAMAQGTTFSVSSGDSGAYECDTSTQEQSYPAVSPYVMAIGGTSLSTTGGTTWAGETVWACTSWSSCQQSANGGAGGGASTTETAPSWQTATGVFTGTKRAVPDVSFDADPASGALVLLNGSQEQIGGTSLAAPLFAGFYARIQAAHGLTAPFPAPTLWAGAQANPQWFHDVTSGSQGNSAKVGYDYASGWGSLQVANFSAAFTGGGCTSNCTTPTANFTDTVSSLTATFTDASSDVGGTISSYSWNFGDSTAASTVKSPVHTYAASGSYTVTETVTDSGGKTASHSAVVTVSSGTTPPPPPPPPSNLILNGGFESGATSWTASSGVVCTNSGCSGEVAHAGTGFAWLDGYGSTHTDTLSQSITIPAGTTNATLSFYVHIDTKETTKTTAYDKLTVTATSGAATTLATYSNLNAATGYVLKSFSLNAYIGKTVTLKFTGTEDSSLATSFVLDDVAVSVQ